MLWCMSNMQTDLQRLGAVISSRLESQDRTQKWLAEKVDVSQPTISRIVQGRYNPDTDVLYRIGQALSVDPLYLLRLAGLPIPDSPLDPTAAYIARQITELPPDLREKAIELVGEVVDSLTKVAGQREATALAGEQTAAANQRHQEWRARTSGEEGAQG